MNPVSTSTTVYNTIISDVIDVVTKTAERVVEPGRWIQHSLFDTVTMNEIWNDDGQPLIKANMQLMNPETAAGCLMGNLIITSHMLSPVENPGHKSSLYGAVEHRVRHYVARKTEGHTAEGWNDMDGRTAHEVAEMLRGCADYLREELL